MPFKRSVPKLNTPTPGVACRGVCGRRALGRQSAEETTGLGTNVLQQTMLMNVVAGWGAAPAIWPAQPILDEGAAYAPAQ